MIALFGDGLALVGDGSISRRSPAIARQPPPTGAAITFCVYFIHVWVLRWFTPLDLDSSER